MTSPPKTVTSTGREGGASNRTTQSVEKTSSRNFKEQTSDARREGKGSSPSGCGDLASAKTLAGEKKKRAPSVEIKGGRDEKRS